MSAEESDAIWLTSSSYTQPTTLAIAEAAAPAEQEPLKSLPAFYEAAGLQTQQLFATSADGTKVPYFLISIKSGPNPDPNPNPNPNPYPNPNQGANRPPRTPPGGQPHHGAPR